MIKSWAPHITIGGQSNLHPFKERQQGATWHSLKHALSCWHRLLSQLLEVLPRDLRQSCEVLCKRAPSGVRTDGNQGRHAIGPPRPVHLLGYTAFNHCQTSSP
jgi:hypothetical protein